MLDFGTNLEKLSGICGNALLFLALAVASIFISAGAPSTGARDPQTTSYPDGWRAPQQSRVSAPAAREPATTKATWSRAWTESE